MGEWGGQSSGGKITVLRAGPGYHEQKEYDIGPDGRITEVTSTAAPLSIMENDACKGGKNLLADYFVAKKEDKISILFL